MSIPVELMSIRNPGLSSLSRVRSTPLAILCASPSLRLHPCLIQRSLRGQKLYRAVVSSGGPDVGFCYPFSREVSTDRSFVASASSHEESPSEIKSEKNKRNGENDVSDEDWNQTLASLKEQVSKIQRVSLEAYNLNSQKAMIVLKETSEQLTIQADKAKEIGKDGKEYILKATEDSPADVREVIESFSPIDDLKDVSRMDDFHIGIPFGLLLCIGGFLSFMVTGSIPAIRFGVILGGALFAMSLASLKAQKKGESSAMFLNGQAVITTIIFLREIRLLLSQRCTFFGLLTTCISGGVLAFLAYKIGDKKGKEGNRKMKRKEQNEGYKKIINGDRERTR